MANNNENKILNVPNLRFPEFSGEWKKCTLGDITINFNLRNKEKIELPMYSVTNNRGFIPQSEQFEDRDMVGEDIKAYKIIHNKDFAYNPARINVGSIAKYNGSKPCMISSLYVCFKATDGIDEDWLMHLLRSPKIQYYYNINGEGGVRIYLFYPNFARIRTSFPTIAEQRKIANLLSLLDARITTQNKIIEDLKKLKSAIIDKTFCYPNESSPQKRFIGFTEEWHLVHLSDICQRVRTKNFNTQCTLVLTIAAQFGLVSQEEFFNKSVASDNLEGYYLLRKGDFAYNKSYSGDYAWGAVKRLEYFSEGVLSPLYICFRPDTARIDSDFLAHYFESKKWYKGIADIAGEGARNHGLLNLSVIDYFKTLHRIPSIQEQKVIANVLNKLTSKMSIEKNLYDDLLLQRQHLLQQMFI